MKGSVIQDRVVLWNQILRLWSSFEQFQADHGTDALSDEDVDLWARVAIHPACRQGLDDEQRSNPAK